jgi:predicted Zn-dependent protease
VALIVGGEYRETLVSPRSAIEYGAATNGASSGESPHSVDMAGGTLPLDRVLRELGTGLFVGNLHYLNYSDRVNCRTTGMTRFATFWVEGGVIQGPVQVMRFDETIYRLLGENLVALTAEREMILDPLTYGGRSTRSARVPGALVDDFTFTL